MAESQWLLCEAPRLMVSELWSRASQQPRPYGLAEQENKKEAGFLAPVWDQCV